MERLHTTYAQVCTVSYFFFFAWKVFIIAFIYLNLWSFFGSEALPPNGTYFHLLMIFIAAHVCAKISLLFNLPPLFGMLVAGMFD